MTVTSIETGDALARAAERLDEIRALQARVQQMQATPSSVETRPVGPALASLLPYGGLRVGAAYAVDESLALTISLVAQASADGAWCGVVGVPELGAEAAARAGVVLDRTVLVPHPAEHWVAVAAAFADVLGVVVLRPPARVAPGDAERLSARLRAHGSTLVVLGDWPRAEAVLRVRRSRWDGLEQGRGHLRERLVEVESRVRTGPPRTALVRIGADGCRPGDETAAPSGRTTPRRLEVAG